MSRPMRLAALATWIGIVLVVAALRLVTASDDDDDTAEQAADVTTPVTVGQIIIRGAIDAAAVEGNVLDDVSMPMTIEPEGSAGATITGVTVDGSPADIRWSGATSLVISGSGPETFDIERASFRLQGQFLRAEIGGRTHQLSPGTYRIDSPVEVVVGDTATPVDSVAFSAPGPATVELRGAVSTGLPVDLWRLSGPGTVSLTGDLTVERPDQPIATGAAVRLDTGAFEVRLEGRDDGTWTVTGVVQGDLILE